MDNIVGIEHGQIGEDKTYNAAGVSHKRHWPNYAFTKLEV